MHGKTVVITGGNAGIGKETAVALARAGARVIITARDPAKGGAAVDDIVARSGSMSVEQMHLDLASITSIRDFAAALDAKVDRLSVLINNAGVILRKRQTTHDGFEMTFSVNHLGHFLLTELLHDLLEQAAPSRIVVVASDAYKGARRGLDFDDLNLEHTRYRPFKAYCRSKLANILFARELARRLDGSGVTANAVHPGTVATRFARDGDAGRLGALGMVVARPFLSTPEQGARTTVYVASAPELESISGAYFAESLPAPTKRQAMDMAAAGRLWDASTELLRDK
jgi:NAD(P)-dependent dehydrogenase (short-subunit alcohol dehydrogenase family)